MQNGAVWENHGPEARVTVASKQRGSAVPWLCVYPAAPSEFRLSLLGDPLQVCSLDSSPEVGLVPSTEQKDQLRKSCETFLESLLSSGVLGLLSRVSQCLGSKDGCPVILFHFIF